MATEANRRKVLTIVPTSDGQPFYRDGGNECWRTFVFVEKVQSFESVQSVSQAHEGLRRRHQIIRKGDDP